MAEPNDKTIIYNTDDGKADVRLYSKDGVIWMNQQQMALLFDTSEHNISLHIANVLQDKELDEKPGGVARNSKLTQMAQL